MAHGFTSDILADLVRAELATKAIGTVLAGSRPIEVVRLRITDEGLRALEG